MVQELKGQVGHLCCWEEEPLHWRLQLCPGLLKLLLKERRPTSALLQRSPEPESPGGKAVVIPSGAVVGVPQNDAGDLDRAVADPHDESLVVSDELRVNEPVGAVRGLENVLHGEVFKATAHHHYLRLNWVPAILNIRMKDYTHSLKYTRLLTF